MKIVELDAHPRVRLGHAPTPLDDAPNLGADIGIDLYVKRDDCTGLAFGGNKVRQLEFYLGEARAREADAILITGAVQSNFVRLAAAGARQLGMEVHIQLEERVPEVDARYRNSGNVLLDRVLGATLYEFPEGENEEAADAEIQRISRRLAAEGKRPYQIPLSVGHPPKGGLGYVVAAQEIAGQLAERGIELDAVVVASGSGLTHGGLLVGFRALGMDTPVHGVCVRRGADLQHPRMLQRAREIAALIGRETLIDASDVMVTDAVLAPGYGQLNDATMAAITRAARLEGLFLDPVYTGKAMAGLIHLVESGTIESGARVLFMHTGGLPALFAYETGLTRHFSPAN